jgi:hypothetical protein
VTDVEQALVALILHIADQSSEKAYKGPIKNLRERTENAYNLQKYHGAFESALEYLVDSGFAKIHKHVGVYDYVAVVAGGPVNDMLRSGLAKYEFDSKDFLFEEKNPGYPVIASYLELGGAWIEDFAKSLSAQNQAPERYIDSSSWTGNFVVSPEIQAKIGTMVVQMRDEISNLELPNSQKSNALAAVDAIAILADAPDPPWALIMKILQSPVLANLTAIAALIITMIKP